METQDKRPVTELRAALIASARALAASKGNFTLRQICAQSGVSRRGFYRCFAGKQDLLAAIVTGDLQVLGEMTDVMEPQIEQQRVAQGGGGASMTASPIADAWLERRLRVFERALAALESRQENAEREMSRDLSLLKEKLAAVSMPPEAVWDQEAAAIAEAAPVMAPPREILPAPVLEMSAFEMPISETPVFETSAFEKPDEEPISDNEIEDFIAKARAAALRAALPPITASRSLALPRWIAWMGVVAVSLLVCVGLALGNVARATQSEPVSGISYREEPHDALGRLMALADSGDARAQTVLALAYMHGDAPGNETAAMRWGLAAAQQGEPMAQYLIGTLYSKEDAARAFTWYEQAALRGNLKAMHNLAIALAQGQGVAEDDRRAAAWFNRAAAQGYVDSQFDLAVLFERGQGVVQNDVAALKWYLIAAANGDGPSKSRAEQLRDQMPVSDTLLAEQMAASYRPLQQDMAANVVDPP